MRKISTSLTWWHKRAFPAIMFGFLGVWTLAVLPAVINGQIPVLFLLAPFGMAIYGYILMRWLVFSLVDEVLIDEESIVVRNNGDEDRFPITNIINARASLFTSPEQIVLTLREPCRFGEKIVFSPELRWRMPYTPHPFADELMRRAHHR